MKFNKVISLVLPFYNAEKTLRKSIQSIVNQTFTEFEFILVDNNSTDGSLKIAQEFAEKDPRIVILSEARQGVAYASNTGMKYASGKYVARTDADDVSLPDRLALQYQFLEKNTDIDLLGTRVNYKGDSKNKGFQSYVELSNKVLTSEEIFLMQFVELQIINPTIMFRKEAAERYGYYRHGDFPEDYELFLRWLNKGAKMAKLPDYLLDWHDSENRLTRSDKRYSFDAFYRTKTPYLVDYLKKNNPFHPKVLVWGAGRLSGKRANLLKEYGIEIENFIDIHTKKLKRQDVIYYEELAPSGKHFVLSYVSNRGAREIIKSFLEKKGYTAGKDFLLIA